jgi:cyclopropane-fatty-acyl-phospholipid synthase
MQRNTTTAAALASVKVPFAAKRLLKLLTKITHGELHIQCPDGAWLVFGKPGGLQAYIILKNWRVFSAAIKSGDIGFAETYIAGDWHTPQLAHLLQVLIQNRDAIEKAVYGHPIGRFAYQVKHWLNRNTKANSRKNIHAHYDLGNDFYRLWLDNTMNYSSALYANGITDMAMAQTEKVRRALQEVGLKPGQRLLEIGCGWGALAEMATNEFQSEMVGLTLSTEQLDWANKRLAATPNGHLADLRLQDYRDIGVVSPEEPFDAICSIEMIEAVGRAYWPTYFDTIAKRLKPGGKACIQSIVIADHLFSRYIQGTDFIQQYIFPGGCLPSPHQFRESARRAGLRVVNEKAFGRDYAETLRTWRHKFLQEEPAVRALGFDTPFIRTWEFYLAYCEAAFMESNTDVIQFTLEKPTSAA